MLLVVSGFDGAPCLRKKVVHSTGDQESEISVFPGVALP